MTDSEPNPLPVVGYTDRLSVQPGETIEFKVSCNFPTYHADIVRIRHSSTRPGGPGLLEDLIDTAVTGDYPGRRQVYPMGSYILVPLDGSTTLRLDGFTIQAWILPTTPERTVQSIISGSSQDGSGSFALLLDPLKGLELRIVDGKGSSGSLQAGRVMRSGAWYFVAATFDPVSGRAQLVQTPTPEWPGDETSIRVEGRLDVAPIGTLGGSLVMGARIDGSSSEVGYHFNGKIDHPVLLSRALSLVEIESLALESPNAARREDFLGSWDFSIGIMSTNVTDASDNGLHGHAVNNPKRAVTGHNWTGREVDFKRAPQEYGAIYFHEDDLEDAKWETDFRFKVPGDFKTGIYAARLRSGEHKDYLPFFVRPGPDGPKAKVAFLVPTLSYIAYANFHAVDTITAREWVGPDFRYPVAAIDKYLMKMNLTGFYDHHTDMSGVSYVSRRIPLLDIRPDFEDPLLDMGRSGMHQFPADTCLTDWLDKKGFDYDIITDEDLHNEGPGLLKSYRVVLTGSHPEYYTEKMLDAVQSYLDEGGRVMYLGGNGFYWVTTIDPQRPHILELRRWGGTQGWRSEPGESYHSTTGEMGGTWRNRGRPPQKMVGVGFTSQGIDNNRAYRRMPDSFDPRMAFVFEGIGEDELIGDFENLVNSWGAAGFENDRLDFKLGTSPKAFLLATATGFTDVYQCATEEVDSLDGKQGGTTSPFVRADIVYLDYPKGGAVFSVGSISWVSCLSYNRYENNVSRMTENVLRRFLLD